MFVGGFVLVTFTPPSSVGEFIEGEVVFGGFAVLAFVLLMYTVAANSDFILTEDGISRSFWGFKWRTLKWSEVKSIWITRVLMSVYGIQRMTVWTLFRSADPHIGGIFTGINIGKLFFRDTIENLDGLIEAINSHILGRNVRIVDYRSGSQVLRDSL